MSFRSGKMSYRQAAKLFVSNKTEGVIFLKIVSFFGLATLPVTIFDEWLAVIPGLNLVALGDDLLWPGALYAAVRIVMIRHKANSQKPSPQAIPAYRR